MKVLSRSERTYKSTEIQGISMSLLWTNDTHGGTALVKMKKHSHFPLHRHPGWEQIYVISGSVSIAGEILSRGDYMFTGMDETHSATANEDSEFLVFSEKGVEIIE